MTAGCNTNSLYLPELGSVRVERCPLMLLFFDASHAAAELSAGELRCPHRGCDGRLGPWGHARRRWVRLPGGHREAHRPRRARCRSCRRTQVLAETRIHPRRADAVETVGAARLAAAAGLSDQAVAAELGLPATTVRDWLRRASVNAEAVRADATAALYRLDPDATRIVPTGSPLGDMVNAVGLAVAAWVRRFGPSGEPWRMATVIAGAGILAARPPAPRWWWI